jgi:hypothetical protein
MASTKVEPRTNTATPHGAKAGSRADDAREPGASAQAVHAGGDRPTHAAELLRNQFFFVQGILGTSLIEIRRTSETFSSLEQMQRAFAEVAQALDRAGRGHSTLLVDTREAPPRNDPAFEAAFEPLRVAMIGGFRRVAIVVRTTAGRLQVERHVRRDGFAARAFMDVEQARAYCIYGV